MKLELDERGINFFDFGVPPGSLPLGLHHLPGLETDHRPLGVLHQVLLDELAGVGVNVVPNKVLRLPDNHADVLVGNVAER